MPIIKLQDALKKGDKKLVKKITKNTYQLRRLAYDGKLAQVIELVKTQPVDIDYIPPTSTLGSIEQCAASGGSGIADQIIAFFKEIRAGKSPDQIQVSLKKPSIADSIKDNPALKRQVKAYEKKFAKPFCRLDLSLSTPCEPVITSHFGGYVFGESLSDWPLDQNGKRLPFLLQIRLDEPEYCPEMLSEYTLIVIYSDLEKMEIRAYKSLDHLICLNPARDLPCASKFAKIIFSSPESDYPSYQDLCLEPYREQFADVLDDSIVHEITNFTAKIGGYPAVIQNEPRWQYEPGMQFFLQLTEEPSIDLQIHESLYLAIDTSSETIKWQFEIQMN